MISASAVGRTLITARPAPTRHHRRIRRVIDEFREVPAVLTAAHQIWLAEFEHWYDYQPEDLFDEPDEINDRWQDWSGNPGAGPGPFRVFARDGTDGLPAFGIREPDTTVEAQPIVFFGSEGELAVIARDLWLLANGLTPLEPGVRAGRGPGADPGARHARRAPHRTPVPPGRGRHRRGPRRAAGPDGAGRLGRPARPVTLA
jgi:hypothetical protein